jgi:hypothetical protein
MRPTNRTVTVTINATAMLAAMIATSTAYASTSKMSEKAGVINEINETIWCFPQLLSNGGKNYAQASLVKIGSDGTRQTNFVSETIQQRVRIQCFSNSSLTGQYTTYTSDWSTASGGSISKTSVCPSSKRYGGFLRCQVRDNAGTAPTVYAGTSCGNGVKSISPIPAAPAGELTGPTLPPDANGYTNYMSIALQKALPLYNDTSASYGVYGTDIAATFYSNGSHYIVFGDTFSNAQADGWRSNTLATTYDLDPSDSTGISELEFVTEDSDPKWAIEVIESAHQTDPTCPAGQEWTRVPGAAFGYKTSDSVMNVVWYISVNCWDQEGSHPENNKANYSAFAYQAPDGTFAPWNSPKWDNATSNFYPGAVWLDRVNGYAYLFGVSWFYGGVRMARVKISDGVDDSTKYDYWSSTGWVRDTDGDGSEAAPSATVAIIPATPGVGMRAEMSVAWNSYANRFILAGLRGLSDGTAQLELWISPAPARNAEWPSGYLTGQWQRVAYSAASDWYAPMMSETYLMNGGKDVYFLLSKFTNMYNVGLFKYAINRGTAMSNCNTADN